MREAPQKNVLQNLCQKVTERRTKLAIKLKLKFCGHPNTYKDYSFVSFETSNHLISNIL